MSAARRCSQAILPKCELFALNVGWQFAFNSSTTVHCSRAQPPMFASRYMYRAVDKAGKTVDFHLSRKRDVNAAKAFLRKAMRGQRVPTKITLDGYAASHRAVADLKDADELPKRVVLRSSKYLNNLIEQDHRRIKQRLRPMLGLKSFRTARVVIGGIELAERIKKGQFKIGKLGGSTATIPEMHRSDRHR